MRTLPYLKAWHERYAEAGLRVIGVHTPGFPPSADPDAVTAAVARLGIEYPVVIDSDFEIWQEYENLGWPARYLFGPELNLFEYHYGEGAYAETEAAIQELLGVIGTRGGTGAPRRRARRAARPAERRRRGPLQRSLRGGRRVGGAGRDGDGQRSDRETPVDGPGAYELIRHEHSTAGELELEVGPGVTCLAVCFTPGLAP